MGLENGEGTDFQASGKRHNAFQWTFDAATATDARCVHTLRFRYTSTFEFVGIQYLLNYLHNLSKVNHMKLPLTVKESNIGKIKVPVIEVVVTKVNKWKCS